MTGLTQAEFARRAGCSQQTVSAALRSGRLTLLPEGGIDPKLLRTKWRAWDRPKSAANESTKVDTGTTLNADGTPRKKRGPKKPDDAPPTSASEYAAVALAKERALAGLRQLEYEQRAGSLISIELARNTFFQAARASRDAWLNWPSRVAPRVAAELGVEPEVVLHVLSKHVREHMVALAEPEADFGPHEP